MKEPVYEQLTLFPEDFHASLSLRPGSTAAQEMTVTSGRKCSELYGNSGPLGSLVRMCLESSIWHSTRCFLTWKTKDTKLKRLLFQLAVSMPRTNGNESLFWPTVLANGMGSTGHQKMLQKLVDKGILTAEERRKMICGNCGQIAPDWAEWLMGYTKEFTRLIPTPIASMYKGGCPKRYPEGGQIRQEPTEPHRVHSPWQNWPDEPGVDRVANGIPNRVDRVRSLGNAVVPQQFYLFFKLIADIERG